MKKLLILMLICALLTGCAAGSVETTEAPATEPAATEEAKIMAPDFTVYDVDGNARF